MGHMIEAAKSGRASCRTCKETIAKGEFRLGEEVPNAFSPGEMTYHWHHLPCGAKKRPAALKQALEETELDIPDKDDLLNQAQESGKTEKPASYPYAEHAPTGRASCQGCEEKIEKGDLRVAVEAELNAGGFMRKGSQYLHPACAVDHTGEEPDELFSKIKANTLNLSPADLEALEADIFG